jgi:hypothetical protein
MATFDPIPYQYVPTVPRNKRATTQHIPAQKESSIPDKIHCIKPDDTLFDDIRQVAVAVVSADEDPGYRSEILGMFQYQSLQLLAIVTNLWETEQGLPPSLVTITRCTTKKTTKIASFSQLKSYSTLHYERRILCRNT